MIREGYEWIAPFEKALIAERTDLQTSTSSTITEYYYNYLYVDSGLYAAQIERYLKTFPREQLHVILFEALKLISSYHTTCI